MRDADCPRPRCLELFGVGLYLAVNSNSPSKISNIYIYRYRVGIKFTFSFQCCCTAYFAHVAVFTKTTGWKGGETSYTYLGYQHTGEIRKLRNDNSVLCTILHATRSIFTPKVRSSTLDLLEGISQITSELTCSRRIDDYASAERATSDVVTQYIDSQPLFRLIHYGESVKMYRSKQNVKKLR